jgi:uncharacterized membrane protein SpoIIM required for sporulation
MDQLMQLEEQTSQEKTFALLCPKQLLYNGYSIGSIFKHINQSIMFNTLGC